MTHAQKAHRACFLVLTYNQAHLVRESALAALAQDCEPLEIVFSDDASTDNTFEVLQEIAAGYHGPHRLTVRRNPQNLGIGEHFNVLIRDIGSQFFIASAGDDISLPQRARTLLEAWDRSHQKADLISAQCIRMHFDGTLGEFKHTDNLEGVTPAQWLESRPFIIGATHAFTKRLHTHFGPFNRDVVCEDQAMVFRAACLGTALTLPEAQVHYRDGGVSKQTALDTPAQILAWERKTRRLHIIEARQILRDAKTAGLEDLAKSHLEQKLHYMCFLDDLAQHENDSFGAMMAVGRRHPQMPFFWRYKKVLTSYFRESYAVIRRKNEARKQFFRRLRKR
jgi:glycosyltransferase involved in cell wall biosynthesis